MKMKLIVALVFVNTIIPSIYSQSGRIEVTYIGNCGFLLSSNDKQILIDALFYKGFDYYSTPADSVVLKIQKGQEPFAHANMLLITHDHPDHFDVNMVGRYLANNPENRVIAPSLVINSIRSQSIIPVSDKQLVEIDELNKQGMDTIIRGVKIKSFSLQHDNRPKIQNVGYLVEIDGIKVFHSGDNTGAVEAEFDRMQLHNRNVDLALLNFYGFRTSKEERDFTKSHINPKNIVLMHIPPKEMNVVKDSCDKISDFIDITIFRNCMDRKSFVYY
jgi:L-ascorbate metabolism protein UlaG (beta-lactamase superfamily)